jgi:glycosyltransferase involved in cell wall biosynthesis
LTAVSQFTMNQLIDLCPSQNFSKPNWKVIYNSFNANFYPMALEERTKIVASLGIPANVPYILHVGSALPRKNRVMLLEMVSRLGNRWNGNICFAGFPLNESLIERIKELGLENRVFSVVKPQHEHLVALYSHSQAFIFPSFSEGFGWPLIEGQACGTMVIASNIEPMPEISNNTTLLANPYEADDFANALLRCLDENERQALIKMGFENCKRFDTGTLTRQFIELYTKAG